MEKQELRLEEILHGQRFVCSQLSSNQPGSFQLTLLESRANGKGAQTQPKTRMWSGHGFKFKHVNSRTDVEQTHFQNWAGL